MILPVISIVLFIMIIAITAMAVLRAQRLLGIIPVKELRRHALIVGPTGSGKTTIAKKITAEANMAAALLRRLYWLQIDEERPDESVYRDNAVTIYDLSATGSNYLKTLYSLTILSKKYYEALRNGTADELVEIIIAEECQNYVRLRRFDDPPSIGERDVYELRGFGIGVVLVCPDPELLPPSIPKDVAAIVSMSADTIPRFALERYLFRASLEEAERTLGALKKAKMVVYYAGKLHYLRRLPRPPRELRLKARPKGDRMGVTDPGAGRCEHGQSSPAGLPADPQLR
jgi:hypothetical protein